MFDIIREADEAFWEVIARSFPKTKNGDLSPLTTLQLARAQENAVEEWVTINVFKDHAQAA